MKALSCFPRTTTIVAASLAAISACPTDNDLDGYMSDVDCVDDPSSDLAACSTEACSSCLDPACGVCAHCTHPDAIEHPDLVDNDCDGIDDEPPVGFYREGYSMQGAAAAVVRYGDYLYLASMSVIRPYYAPPGAVPEPAGPEIELRDWVRDMTISGDTLFVANRGDGLHAFALADPAHPEPAGKVTGLFDAPPYTSIEAVFYDVDVKGTKVAVACFNYVTKAEGGVDAVVFDYDPVARRFTPDVVVTTAVRHVEEIEEVPLSIALTEDASSLYIGYGWIGELVYLELATPEQSRALPLPDLTEIFVYDIATVGSNAIAAITSVCDGECSMFSRIYPSGDTLEESPILTYEGSSAGAVVDVEGDLVLLGTWGVHRYYEAQENMWVYRVTDLETLAMERVAGADTMDWIYQLELHDAGSEPGWVYVADEWGGLEVWDLDGSSLTLEVDADAGVPVKRVPTGALSSAVWTDGSRVYSGKRGAALWVFEEAAPDQERVAVEWIDPSDPGCTCEGCECPDPGAYPPSVFVYAGAASQGWVAVLAANRADKIGMADGTWFMMFEETEGRYVCRYASHLADLSFGLGHIRVDGEIVFASRGFPGLQVYQHCPGAEEDIRLLVELFQGAEGMNQPNLVDTALYGDYLFVLEQTISANALLLYPIVGSEIQVYRWKEGALEGCGASNSPAVSLSYLGAFSASESVVLRTLSISPDGAYLFAGGEAVYLYDLKAFDPDSVGALDAARLDITPGSSVTARAPDVTSILAEPGAIYLTDRQNGLYRYNLDSGQYDKFYPGLADINTNYPLIVQSPDGIVPLFQPYSVARAGSGRLVVQEFTNGRVSILSEE